MNIADQRTIIRLSRRIKKLEADIALANARIAGLEARQSLAIVSPALPTPLPGSPWPGWPTPYIGDVPFSGGPGTCSTSTSKTTDFKVI